MAEGTYEYECMRAELLGIEKPDEQEFEKARAQRVKQEEEEQEAAEAALLEAQEEALKGTGGKLDELNHILSSTQQKLNRFKQTACGSFSNIFNRGSVDIQEPGAVTSSSSTGNSDTVAVGQNEEIEGSSNTATEVTEGEHNRVPPDNVDKIRNTKQDIQKKMTSHLDKLDSLINKAEQAEVSMSEQTKQMRRMAK